MTFYIVLLALIALPIAEAGWACDYCKYCDFCGYCSECPCTRKKHCDLCVYCKYCGFCQACPTFCGEDSFLQQAYSFFLGSDTSSIPTEETLKEHGAPSHDSINQILKAKGTDLKEVPKKPQDVNFKNLYKPAGEASTAGKAAAAAPQQANAKPEGEKKFEL